MKITDKILSGWIDDSLPPKKMTAVSAAVQSDPALQARAEALRAVGAALRAETVELPVSAERMVQDVRREIRRKESLSPLRVSPRAWAGAAVSACLLVAAILVPVMKKGDVTSVQAQIESVDSELSGASTMVYTDHEAGWTVVWLDGVKLEPGT